VRSEILAEDAPRSYRYVISPALANGNGKDCQAEEPGARFKPQGKTTRKKPGRRATAVPWKLWVKARALARGPENVHEDVED